MAVYVVLAAFGLIITALWFVRGRQIRALRLEVRGLRAYVVHLDEAERLTHAPPPQGGTVTRLRRRRRGFSILPVAILGAVASSAILASSALVLPVLQDATRPRPEAHDDRPPTLPAPVPETSRSHRPTRASRPAGDEDESAPATEAEPAAAEEPPPRPTSHEPDPTVDEEPPPVKVKTRTDEGEGEPAAPVDELVDVLVDTEVDLRGSAPEPPTLLGKAGEESRAVRPRVS